MFLTLLLVTFVIAVSTSVIVAWLFDKPVTAILRRIIAEEIATAWVRYIKFAIYVVGISGGVRVWELERYITPRTKDEAVLVLNSDRWVLEIYRTIIGTLQSVAWMLLLFFAVALIAFVLVKNRERKNDGANP